MRKKPSIKRSKGFTLVELLLVIIGILIFGIVFVMLFKKGVEKNGGGTFTCVEWEDVTYTDCWSYGMGTQCESYIEKRCARYEFVDGGATKE